MYSFLICVCILIAGYLIYGKFVDKVFGPDPSRPVPAITKNDGVDFVPMPTWKIFMIQFLNIAGTGPIFGAIMGAKFGPSCYLWIVFGCIFAGAVHDYLSGMLSIRHDGASLPDIIGHYQGKAVKSIVTTFIMILMILVGAVFVYSPALILSGIASPFKDAGMSGMFWVFIIFAYYVIATMLPIDKIIGKIYPLFAIALLFMAFSLFIGLLTRWPSIPELWQGLGNRGPQVGMNGQSIFPCLFITVACGAISGFHATQSPMMARCMKSEKYGRPIFFGAMITEGIVALIWAAIGSYFFFGNGMSEVGAASGQAPVVVTSVAKAWLGAAGSVLALLGVVAAPITSGDTAFRSARLILSDILKVDQKPVRNRLFVSLPLFILAGLMLWYNIADENGFNTIWRYFGWANQSLACFTLWTIAIYLNRNRKGWYFLIGLIPAAFMTSVCLTYICIDKTGFHLPTAMTPWLAGFFAAVPTVLFLVFSRKGRHKGREFETTGL